MSQQPGDTIAAISSAVGPAARMIVRASGPQVRTILQKLTGAPDAGVSSASRLTLRFAGLQISAWVYLFIAPRSVTGEDVLELHVPGNPLLARMLLDELFRMGARQAEPGEFTSRAYFNGRLDLTEAEGVAATIAAQSERELAAARQLMAGELARRLRPVLDSVAETLALIEVGIDFSEEEVTFLSAAQIGARVQSADESLRDLLSQSSRFERLAHEPQIVLVGRPNAGKSTLLNALAGHERAVVSPHAGTTRDAIWAHVPLSRGTVRLIDVAGIDPSGATSPISKLMQQQTLRTIEEADAVVLVRDCTDHRAEPSLPRAVDLIVDTKADLLPSVHMDRLHVSARSGINMDELRLRLDRIAFGDVSSASTTLALNARHVQAIDEARQSLTRCREQLQSGAGSEILAMDLREALDALGQVLGSVSPDDPLTRIFSNFCIGK